MYVITNRKINERRKTLSAFSKDPNPSGPNELRLLEVNRTKQGRWRVAAQNDKLSNAQASALIKQHHLDLDPADDHYASLRVACDLATQARRQKKNIVLFVHGFNNDVGDILKRCFSLEQRYQAIVLPFSWPANGGGAVSGVLSYKSDKRDARASTGALDRVFAKLDYYLDLISAAQRKRLTAKARAKYRDQPALRDAYYTELMAQECPFTVNLLVHSMGNYLFKQLLRSTASDATRLMFDNIVLAAPDTNNFEHALWLDRIRARKRVYVAINEHDFALGASRLKSGEEQLARLGHVTYGLEAKQAVYVDFTNAAEVGNAHTYFDDEPAEKNPRIQTFFEAALNGRIAESGLVYDAARNLYRVP